MEPTLIDRALVAARRHGIKGAGAVTRLLRGHNLAFPVLTTTAQGVSMLVDPTDWLDKHIIASGGYEPEVTDVLLAQLRPGDVFWDVGANIGLHALTIRHLMPAVRCVAFEPSPITFSRLVMNARANWPGRDAGLTLLPFALSDHDGYALMDVCLQGNTGTSSFEPRAGAHIHGQRYPIACRLETAQRVISEGLAPAPTVMKIDVEGHEASVLNGMGALLETPSLRAIVFEGDAVATRLQRAGFDIATIAKRDAADNDSPNLLAVRGAAHQGTVTKKLS